jgi:hypothetical protein
MQFPTAASAASLAKTAPGLINTQINGNRTEIIDSFRITTITSAPMKRTFFWN